MAEKQAPPGRTGGGPRRAARPGPRPLPGSVRRKVARRGQSAREKGSLPDGSGGRPQGGDTASVPGKEAGPPHGTAGRTERKATPVRQSLATARPAGREEEEKERGRRERGSGKGRGRKKKRRAGKKTAAPLPAHGNRSRTVLFPVRRAASSAAYRRRFPPAGRREARTIKITRYAGGFLPRAPGARRAKAIKKGLSRPGKPEQPLIVYGKAPG